VDTIGGLSHVAHEKMSMSLRVKSGRLPKLVASTSGVAETTPPTRRILRKTATIPRVFFFISLYPPSA
jgi:hypothetical protein